MANPKRPPQFKTTYKVDSADVFLTVLIGEKQLGASLVKLDGKVLGEGAIKKLKVGNGRDLVGAKLTTKTVVTDINDMTNRTSITLILGGGTVPAEHTLSVECDDNGDSAIYRTEVEFAK